MTGEILLQGEARVDLGVTQGKSARWDVSVYEGESCIHANYTYSGNSLSSILIINHWLASPFLAKLGGDFIYNFAESKIYGRHARQFFAKNICQKQDGLDAAAVREVNKLHNQETSSL